jgi:hypothetical protein
MRAFRVRSAERDQRNDDARIARVGGAIERAVADASSELSGLLKRLDDVRCRAAMCSDTGFPPEEEREAAEALIVSALETQLVAGERRIRKLRCHIEALLQLQSLLRERLCETGPPRAAPLPSGR